MNVAQPHFTNRATEAEKSHEILTNSFNFRNFGLGKVSDILPQTQWKFTSFDIKSVEKDFKSNVNVFMFLGRLPNRCPPLRPFSRRRPRSRNFSPDDLTRKPQNLLPCQWQPHWRPDQGVYLNSFITVYKVIN